jgi:hypothetical protein
VMLLNPDVPPLFQIRCGALIDVLPASAYIDPTIGVATLVKEPPNGTLSSVLPTWSQPLVTNARSRKTKLHVGSINGKVRKAL